MASLCGSCLTDQMGAITLDQRLEARIIRLEELEKKTKR